MASEILVRGLPEDVRAWIANLSHENHLSQNEFVLGILRRAYTDETPTNGQLPLFGQPASHIRTEPDAAVPFSFVDLFAGIGGLRIALEGVGGKCRFSSEWDKHCQRTYKAWFGETPEGDLRKVKPSEIPDHDLLSAGFPCQPFSIAGVSKKNSLGRAHGFKDRTQGTLFFEVARIIRDKRPAAFVLENVKNLKGHDSGRTFKVIMRTLEQDLEYSVDYKIMDGAAFVPQHRERIFIVGFKEDRRFEWPNLPTGRRSVADILDVERLPALEGRRS